MSIKQLDNVCSSKKHFNKKTDECTEIGCRHLDVIDDNGFIFCTDCGEQLKIRVMHEQEWRYYGSSDTKRSSDPNRVQARKSEERSIFKDVETLGFNDKVVSKANELYLETSKGTRIYRGNSRKAVIFACIFFSYKLLGIPQNHENLIQLFGLSRKHGLNGIKMVNNNAPRDSEIHSAKITPVSLIKDLMNKFKATPEQTQEVVDLYARIDNRSSKLKRCRSQSCAAGLVYYWICQSEIEISLPDFSKKAGLSALTITKISREIKSILLK